MRSHLPGDTFKVVECASGREAVEAFERHRPDWTLMDLKMPDLGGLGAPREIRHQYQSRFKRTG
ncbi:MAG: response regulator [Verrucomicrobiales bacterium]|nr:response regulator [Verrucomicrobiales bacterium]MCP5526296.1 response regulator [Verrucomicrobiales bacterium]